MSISIQEAYQKLDILWQMADNPELMMTDLFSKGVSGMNFLYQININGKYILDYLKEHLQMIPIFKDCIIRFSSTDVYVDIPGLKFGKYSNLQNDDHVIKFNINDREYRTISDEAINNYQDVMYKKYELKVHDIGEYWKQFEDLSPISRIKKAFASLHSSKKMYVRVQDFFFWLYVPFMKSKVAEGLQKQYGKVESDNKWAKEQYEDNIARQNFYRKNAPEQIEKIIKKQEEIVQYLNELGYVENTEMSKY